MPTLEELRQTRIEKLERLQNNGINPYPAKVRRDFEIKKILDKFWFWRLTKKVVYIAGRIRTQRVHGKAAFFDLEDASGKIQCFISPADLNSKKSYDEFIASCDIGDFVEVKGSVFKTKKGEKTLRVFEIRIIVKSLLPLPEKWHGLQDVEERYRKRYLDLLMNSEVKEKFLKRSVIIKELRNFFDERGFVEFETPMLQTIPGGATAKPFKTHLNALNLDLYLRIAPELYLKRLLVAGLDKVYELGRNFRNEGMDYSHNPEFTMLEFYWAYSDYKEGMKFAEKFLSTVIKNILGKKQFEFQGNKINFKIPWERIEFNDLLRKHTNINYEDYNFQSLLKKAQELSIKIDKKVFSKGEVADLIYKKMIQPKLVQPTFVIHHPIEMKPLAKPLEQNFAYAATMQLVVAGMELINAYSELNDPVIQEENFKQQAQLRKKGDKEAQPFDKEFLEALEYGMPPAFGFGMGIDRLTVLLTDSHSLREVILFPTMRPK